MFDVEMLVSYLEKFQSEYMQKQFHLEKLISDLQLRLKENTEFIRMLEEKNDPNYEAFTPREVNSRDKEKILELREEQKDLREELAKREEELQKCKERLIELAIIFREAKKYLSGEEHKIEVTNESYGIALLEMQENERQRISRDLHDSTVQNLTGMIHKVELCSKLVDMDPVRCKLELGMLSKTLRDIIDDTRYMIYNLRPMAFDDIGLDTVIERSIDKLQKLEHKKIEFSVSGESYNLKPVIGITLLRIIQEACSNAVHHAQASYIKASMHYYPDKVSVCIEDDGKGFNISEIVGNKKDNSGFGLLMMQERVNLLSGTIEIDSKENCGTKITVNVPIKNKEEL